ncbi:ribosomal L16, mitochondrial [Octopus vulgaris]|uniref:Ribosomal L16, mitochondrial n=2 Tax=Octopus TaxID=6643 RepID=A0AA36BVL1_OCTVU|nr:39S ribosomal protein L16, mitochondrial [Octopus sinensis]CAI9741451.1 ribosomal L16, mitochondrial [Octopus vulgaris]
MSRSCISLLFQRGALKWHQTSTQNSGALMFVPAAGLKDFPHPPDYSNIILPERRRLKTVDKVPQLPSNQRPPKMPRRNYLMRGPELVHNKLQYGDFGIQALTGGRMRWGHYEVLRLGILRKFDESRMFAVWRIDPPWKPMTKKGQGHRMGGGKGSISHYVTPVRAGRIIIEVGGKCEFSDVKGFLSNLAHLMPFPARAVSKQMLEEERQQEIEKEERNVNPFSFEYCVKNNIYGCRANLSKYAMLWYGKYR